MSIGLNINGLAVPSKAKLFDAVRLMRCKWLVVMDDLTLARELSYHFPGIKIAFRRSTVDIGGAVIKDEDVSVRLSPEQWLEERASDTDGKIYLHTTNEPGFNQSNINWHVKLMALCASRHIPLVIGNWSCGVPTKVNTDWDMAKTMLQLLDQHRDLFVLGLHEYAAGIITSGFIGGAPDSTAHHPDFIPQHNWPTKDTASMTMWHCGRYKFVVNYCKEQGIRPPRIVITEHGFDYLSDSGLGDWLQTIKPTAPFATVRGWRTLENYWREKLPDLSHASAYAKQVLYADKYIYGIPDSPVEAQCLYTWSIAPDWQDFDISGSQIPDFIAGEIRQTGTVPAVTPPPVPPVVINPPESPVPVTPPAPPVVTPVVKRRLMLEWEPDDKVDQIMTSSLNLLSVLMGDKVTVKPVIV